MRNVM